MRNKTGSLKLSAISLTLLTALIFMLQAFWSPSQLLAEANGPPAGYEQAEKDPGQQEMQKSVARIQSRIQKLQEEIAALRERALDNNPELESLLQELVLTRNEIMTENMAQEDLHPEDLADIDDQLQDPDISDQKKTRLQQQRKEMFLDYKKAEIRTDQNEQVQELRQKFYSRLLAATQEENPDAEQMLQELERLQHQLRFAKQEAVPPEE